uniref:Uncharacterized protein n=1 Tax=Aegilops tauschii TaxID=37682 RepID=N1QRZ7_AEGTA
MGRIEYNWAPDTASFRPERWTNDNDRFRSKFMAFHSAAALPRQGPGVPGDEDGAGHLVQVQALIKR